MFGRSADVVRDSIKEHDPDVIVSVGQAGGRFAISPERVAINIDDGRIPDNDGQQPLDVPIKSDGPAAYFTSLPIKAMATAMRKSGVPAVVSNTAGTYVCNHIMYQVLYMIDREFPGKRAASCMFRTRLHRWSKARTAVARRRRDVDSAGRRSRAIVEYRDKPDERSVGGALH